jgi:hypothetical protein
MHFELSVRCRAGPRGVGPAPVPNNKHYYIIQTSPTVFRCRHTSCHSFPTKAALQHPEGLVHVRVVTSLHLLQLGPDVAQRLTTLALYRTMSLAAKTKRQAAQHHERAARNAATARGEEYQPSTTYRETWAARRVVILSQSMEALRVAFVAAKSEDKLTWDWVIEAVNAEIDPDSGHAPLKPGVAGRGLHSFPFRLNLSCSVHRVTQLHP